ncbi:hemolysin, partial [Fusobacterium animalis]
ILNALGHESGHYSKEDNKTGTQTIANYSGEKLEDRTKGMVAKEATEDTLAAIRNNKNVITGEEGKKLADSIPIDRREYSTTGFLGGLSASFEGNLTGGAGHYVSIDWKKGIVEEYDTIEGGMNFSNPDIGITGGISIFPFADSAKDIEGRGKVIGADFDPVWIYNLIVKKSDEKGPFSVGGELVYSAEGKFLGVKLYASKSVYPLGIHGGFVYGTKVINKKVITIKEYMKKAHIGSDRTVWRYE